MDSSTHFLTLPDLVIDKIKGSLSFPTLKNLRLVCRATKGWVDNSPILLARLPISIREEERLQEVVQSTTPWNVFNIHLLITGRFDGSSFIPLLTHYAEVLTNLTITLDSVFNYRGVDILFHILSNIPRNLGSLHIRGNLFHNSPPLNNHTLIEYLHSPQTYNLAGLTHLTLEIPSASCEAVSFVREFFAVAFQRSPNLKSIGITTGTLNTLTHGFYSMSTYQNIMTTQGAETTLLQFVMAKRESGTIPEIDFHCGDCDCRGPEDIQPFPLNGTYILQLLAASQPYGCRLLNVPLSAMPTAQQAGSLSMDQLTWLAECIVSVIGVVRFRARYAGFPYYIPPRTKLRMEIEGLQTGEELVGEGIDISLLGFKQDRIPGVEEVLCGDLCTTTRPTLNELQIFAPKNFDALQPIIGNLFPNLRILHVKYAKKEIMFEQLFSLPTLEDLTMERCNLVDRMFPTGATPEWLGAITLRHLRMKDCRTANVTNLIFQNVFKFMNLKTFVITPINRGGSWSVSGFDFKGGLSCLGAEDAVIKDSIQHFEAFIPPDTDEGGVRALLAGFQDLRSSTIHHY